METKNRKMINHRFRHLPYTRRQPTVGGPDKNGKNDFFLTNNTFFCSYSWRAVSGATKEEARLL